MKCNSGMHTHLGADGQTQLKCHNISIKHTNPTAMMYHQMEVQQSSNGQFTSDTQLMDETKNQRRQEELENLGRAFKQIYTKLSARNKNRLIPLGAVVYATERIYQYYQKNLNVKSTKQFKSGYEKGFKTLYANLPKKAKSLEYSPKEFDSVITAVDKRMEQLLNDPKSRRKGTAEYGELLCYWQYLSALQVSIQVSYRNPTMENEEITEDPTYDKVTREINLQRKRAQARTSSLRDAINNKGSAPST